MPKIYKNGVIRNVNAKDAAKLKSEKGYVDADPKKIKKDLQGKPKKKKTPEKASE